ncbi:MAG TPA: hypothetical protein VIN06_06315 [Devosia sp.]
MARATDHFRASDVTLWGIVALCCWGAAVLLANVSAVIPNSVFAGLHASRLDGGTVAQLRTQVAALTEESRRMRNENNLLLQRFDRAETATKEAVQRIGALEVSLPSAVESRAGAAGPGIDRMPTASIGERKGVSFDADGGSVSVTQKPMVTDTQGQTSLVTEPAVPRPLPNAYGLALGFPVGEADAEAQWQNLAAKVGTLLIGLAPLLQDVAGTEDKVIVAGPVSDRAEAEQLCVRMVRVGIPCEPKPFEGEPLPLLN